MYSHFRFKHSEYVVYNETNYMRNKGNGETREERRIGNNSPTILSYTDQNPFILFILGATGDPRHRISPFGAQREGAGKMTMSYLIFV
jgi:hypothetical protein